MNVTAETVRDYLAHEASEDELDRYLEVARERRSLLVTAGMAAIQEGVGVALGKMRPSYLTGLTGTVNHVEWAGRRLATIQFDEKSTAVLRANGRAPEGVTRHYLTGIPVSACLPR
ncbi:hypothetical protein [Streptomyces sp. NRRL S-350]|uniref:hypothetical protein n=1 Tax=Streptomyces sp. NRRL S-350 TaxID=1463902 RepID=UPI0004C0B4B0|nr:hypothetical protein [Streptomyces sp. NRRL S-350]